jgi:hypothetical protein
MNLFFLDLDPKKCAEYHCDKHVVKMTLEITQMLYTAHHLLDKLPSELPLNHYKKISNHNHPMAVWIRSSSENYMYSCRIATELSLEYTFRYSPVGPAGPVGNGPEFNKVHSCDKHIKWLMNNLPKNIPIGKLTNPPLCMPDDSKDLSGDFVKSYRKYYLLHKRHFAKWKLRSIPPWFSYSDIRKYF